MSVLPMADETGFSLLEVIVALAVAGLIAMATSGILVFWNRIDTQTADVRSHLDEMVALGRTLRVLASSAVPRPFRDVSQAQLAGIGGDAQSVQLLSFGPASLRLDRPTPLRLRIRGAGEAKQLVLEWDDPQSGKSLSEVVYAAAKDMRFRYFLRGTDTGPSWSPDWVAPSILPAAIGLTIEDEVLGPPLEIVVRTAGSLPAACILLPADPACQGARP